MAKCLVLGGGGFIGSHICEELMSLGHEVSAFGTFRRGEQNLKGMKVKVIKGDYRNPTDIRSALEGKEYVFVNVTMSFPRSDVHNTIADIENTIKPSIELFGACVEAGVKEVLYGSTIGVYGESKGEPFKETDAPSPLFPYAINKLTVEHYLGHFGRFHGLNYKILRYSACYGERQALNQGTGVINNFLNSVKEGQPLRIHGDGSMKRDLTYVKDIASGAVALMGKETKHKIFNIGSGKLYSLKDYVAAIEKVVGKTVDKLYEESITDASIMINDISRIKKEIGWKPKFELEEGIKRTWEWVRST